jgi:hypothetical protein
MMPDVFLEGLQIAHVPILSHSHSNPSLERNSPWSLAHFSFAVAGVTAAFEPTWKGEERADKGKDTAAGCVDGGAVLSTEM